MNNNSNNSKQDAQSFWDDRYSSRQGILKITEESFRMGGISPESQDLFFEIAGDLDGKSVLEIGCGIGDLTVYLAQKGAHVTAIDFSSVSADMTAALVREHQVKHRVEVHQINALEIESLQEKYDVVLGKFILHHIEPFEAFAVGLSKVLKPGGKAIFAENNSRNPFLMLARSNLVGRFGIPKYGDDDEYPFEPREVEILKQYIGEANTYFPDFICFRHFNTYIFRKNKKMQLFMDFFYNLDVFILKHVPFLHKYSYVQIVEVQAS